jgi:TonB family protein
MAVQGAGQRGGKGPISVPVRGRPDGAANGKPGGTGTGPEITIKEEPRVVDEVKPVYPDDARAKLIEGKVRLRVVVSSSGRVVSARVIQGIFPSLDRAAEAAVKKFQFKPARTSDGRPVEYPIVWTMTFQLDR